MESSWMTFMTAFIKKAIKYLFLTRNVCEISFSSLEFVDFFKYTKVNTII